MDAAEFDVDVDLTDSLSITHRPCGTVIIDGYVGLPLDRILEEAGKHICTK